MSSETPIQAKLSTAALRAAHCCVSTEETRRYLKGVFVEIAERHVTYAATDGSMLLATRVETNEANTLLGEWIIPTETIKAFKPMHKYQTEVVLESADKVTFALGNILFRPIDGTFPDYRRVIPKTFSGEWTDENGSPIAIDPALLLKFVRAGAFLGVGDKPYILPNGTSPARVYWTSPAPDTIAVTILLRAPKAPAALPVWLDASPNIEGK